MKNYYTMIEEAQKAKKPHFLIVLIIPYLLMSLANIVALFVTPLGLFYFLIINFGLTALFMGLYARKVDKRNFPSLGLTKKEFIKDNLLGLALGILMIVIIMLIMLITGNASILDRPLTPRVLQGVLIMFPAWAVQGFSEEFLVRGYMFPALSNRYGLKFGVLISASYFALLHIGNPNVTVLGIINILLVGIIFTLMVMVHDNLWVASGFHIGWNYAQGHLVGIPVSGMGVGDSLTSFSVKNNLYTGGDFGMEGGLICTLVLLALGFLYFLFLKQKRINLEKNSDNNESLGLS